MVGGGLLAQGCGDNAAGDPLARLMDDGDVSAVAPGAMGPPAAGSAPPRFCPTGDCSGSPLAFWTLDDCNAQTTQLADSATGSAISHPAFRAVSATCVASIDGQGIHLAGPDDIVYAPDQPDFSFNQGLTVAAWIDPDSLNGTQSIFRKRLDASSSFVLAIDGRKLTFALRLTNGRTVAIAAPIKAKQFTHVAATYDGRQALLYVNGAVAASARAAGTIAPGAGPIFVGNDANGRELLGTVDDIWLNTLAAPAAVIQALTCIRGTPIATLTPGTTPAEVAGATVSFDLAITNQDGASCPADTFQAAPESFFPVTSATFPPPAVVAPGQTVHLPVSMTTSKAASIGSYPVEVLVQQVGDGRIAPAEATLVIGTGPISCDGTPPATPLITGSFAGPSGGTFGFNAPALAPPTVTTLPAADGSLGAIQVSANPGATTDPTQSFLGVGLFFVNPPCLDASAYTGVQFTITGDLGTCSLAFGVVTSEDNSVANGPVGVCAAGPNGCFGPFSAPLVPATGTTTVAFADLAGGAPQPTADPSALNGVQWTLDVPTDGVTAPCVANFTISDVSFVPATTPPPPDGGGPLPPPRGAM
ncbi:MAG TPA: LamG domain-containing protein [Polyangia bacterium]|nr:LamG domain-containing protein [Polyangia bacterium]